MTVLPRALAWQRTDTTGGEFVVLDDRDGLTARGVAFTATPAKYAARYQLGTDRAWVSTHLEVSVEGEGWQRSVDMQRTSEGWRVTTSEHGNLNVVEPTAPLPGTEDPGRLAAALDVDLYHSPLTIALPVRRLNLLTQPPGTTHTIAVAWILLPSLAVVPLEMTYTLLDQRTIRCASAISSTDVTVDDDGFVVDYPPLATR